MPGKKIQYEHELVRLLEEGKSPAEISRWYLEKKKLEISANAISVFKHRRGVGPTLRRLKTDLIPWVLLSEHRSKYAAQMLRAEARKREGVELDQAISDRLDSWLQRRRETDTVVHYDPETEQGFWYVPRRPGVDDDLIRVPNKSELARMNELNDQRKNR